MGISIGHNIKTYFSNTYIFFSIFVYYISAIVNKAINKRNVRE